jgi:hypothetical protein
MKKRFQKFFEGTAWNSSLAQMPTQLPTAIIVFGVAVTPLWAGVLIWFLFHWTVGQFWH